MKNNSARQTVSLMPLRNRTGRRFALAGILMAVSLVVMPPVMGHAGARQVSDQSQVQAWKQAAIPNARELLAFHLLNASRAANGISPLKFNANLLVVARAHSMDMALHHYFAHNTLSGITPFQRMTAAGILFTTAAENIGTAGGVSALQAVTRVHTEMMAEPPNQLNHRANILNKAFQQVGIGVYTSLFGVTYLTEDFTN